MPWDSSSDGVLRLGDTYDSCLDLVEHTSIGVCWDFGHTFRASYLKKHDLLPGDHFIARVKHVHAHDTIAAENGPDDHYPLGDGISPWKKYCSDLARFEYNDNILLETNTSRFESLETFLHSAHDSIEKLKFFFGNKANLT
jgi:sugar phosphate isomerase/epimerase